MFVIKIYPMLLTVAVVLLTACDAAALLATDTPLPPTPAVEQARFTTPTLTPLPSQTPTPAPTRPATATRLPRPSATATTAQPAESSQPNESVELDERDAVEDTAESEAATATPEPEPTATTVATSPADVAPTEPPATATAPPAEPPPLSGRIAFPVDDNAGHYDVWVIDLPDGEPFLVQARARQPNFSDDGRLLVKMQASPLGESIGLLDANYVWQGILNESPEDSYPFWHPDGRGYSYSNNNLAKDPDTAHLAPHIFTACSLQLPKFENSEKCRYTLRWGQIGVGEAPVWTDDDQLAFFSYKGDDGIYVVESASMLRELGGLPPSQLVVESNGLPSDTAGAQLYFSAGNIDANWEAYMVDLDGSNLTNLSNAPLFQDGLPTVSPDGEWVAFVSDREGRWGIWAVPRRGGEPVRLVDLSKINTNPSPWGSDRRAWTTERISWGP